MAGIAMMVGGALVNAVAFTGSGYSKHYIKMVMKLK
jgi:hypothetical protein